MNTSGDKSERPAMWFFGCAIIVTGLLNLFAPRAYLLFGINHVSFLPVSLQVGWMLIALVVVVLAGLRRKAIKLPAETPYLIACLFVASFFIFRTAFPAVHGDGAVGPSPVNGLAPALKDYPEMSARLQSYLAYGFAQLVPRPVELEMHNSQLVFNAHAASAWVLLTMFMGVGIVAFVTTLVMRASWDTAEKVGVQMLLLSAPALANAYGHFDSYIVPIACTYLWLWTLHRVITHEDRVQNIVYLLVAVLLCIWAHPVLTVTAYTSLVALFFVSWGQWRTVVPKRVVLLAGLGCGLLPIVAGQGNWDLIKAENMPIVHWLVHEKIMSCVQVGLAGLLLAGWVCIRDKRLAQRPTPLQAIAIIMLLGSCITFLTLWVGYGVADEFLYALLGVPLVGSAVLLYVAWRVERRVIIYAAVLSLYLFAPKVAVYSYEAMLARFDDHFLQDRCAAHRRISPYRLAAMSWPVDQEAFRQRRIELLEEGFFEPLPHLKKFQVENLIFYVAWCFEFERLDEGYLQLKWLVDYAPEHLPSLWHWDDQLHTSRYKYVARYISRDLSRQIIEDRLSKNPDDEQFPKMLRALEQFEAADPSPYRAIIDMDE